MGGGIGDVVGGDDRRCEAGEDGCGCCLIAARTTRIWVTRVGRGKKQECVRLFYFQMYNEV